MPPAQGVRQGQLRINSRPSWCSSQFTSPGRQRQPCVQRFPALGRLPKPLPCGQFQRCRKTHGCAVQVDFRLPQPWELGWQESFAWIGSWAEKPAPDTHDLGRLKRSLQERKAHRLEAGFKIVCHLLQGYIKSPYRPQAVAQRGHAQCPMTP